MGSVVSTAPAQPVLARWSARYALSRAECIALTFFTYLAVYSCFKPMPALHRVVLCCLPAVLWLGWRLESARGRRWTRVVRDWSCLALILVAYWLLEWFASPPLHGLAAQWIEWDRTLLNTLGLRSAIEAFGGFLPGVLETVYLSLYAIPTACLGVVYAERSRAKVDRFLLILFIGTFSAYAILPLVPVASPREYFPGSDVSQYSGPARQINTWLLDHLDISTGVFPSGHVAVAFSSAFGLLASVRKRRWTIAAAFVIAALVYVATIYGRYHFAVDGFASVLIATASWVIARRMGA